MKLTRWFLGLLLVFESLPAAAAQLQPATAQAWEQYVRSADKRIAERVDGCKPFLWTDESPTRRQRVAHGEIVVAPVAGEGAESVPNGLIHDWIGAVFIPHATIAGLLRVVHDYDRYAAIYKPVVARSASLAAAETHQEFSMVWRRRALFVNFAMEGRYEANDVTLDAHRGYSVIHATEVREFQDYGHNGQRLLPAGTGSGFVWHVRSVARYEERDGGVYLEMEALALTRDIPPSMRWLIVPLVNRISVNSLTATLRQTRDAVQALPAADLALGTPRPGGPGVAKRGER